MLSKKAFIAGMTLVKKNYIGWQFDLNDEVQVSLWYSAFVNLTDERFTELVNDYMSTSSKPPMCIKDLTDIYVERQVKYAQIPPEKALSFVREVISDCGGWQFEGRTDIYKKLRRYPELYDTVKEFEDTLRDMASGDTYVETRFRKAYENNLYEGAKKQVNEFLGITVSNTQALGSAALPYEM